MRAAIIKIVLFFLAELLVIAHRVRPNIEKEKEDDHREKEAGVADIYDKKHTSTSTNKAQAPFIDFHFVETYNKTECTTSAP